MIITPGQLNRRSELYHQLGAMISAGVPLLKALEMAGNNPAARASRETIQKLIEHLKAGLTFTESMRLVEGWMPEFDIALLSVGETSGRLDSSFRQLANYYATRAKIIRDTIAGLVTTVATLHVFLMVFPLGYLIAFVQGIMNSDYALCLPFVLEKLAVFGIAYLTVAFLIFASQGNRGESWRALVESLFGTVPILRTARQYLTLSRLAAALGALISSGVSIIDAWLLAAAASGSPRLKYAVTPWRTSIEAGVTPGELVNSEGYFPEMFSNLYNTGEQSGQLDDTLKRLQNYYEEEGFRKLRLFTRIMNGTIYGLVVLLVAYNVIHFYVGYYGQMFNSVGF